MTATTGRRQRRAPAVVAVVAAFDREDTVGDTVRALAGISGVREVVVVDDGSTDATAAVAAEAGARVVRLEANRGKGAAVATGTASAPDADCYLLVDADVGATAAGAAPLLDAVLRGRADLAIGVLPADRRSGGLGMVRRLAAAGIARATGWRPQAPLSGQRAVRGELLRSLPRTERFGLETAMTIDAARAGAHIVEVPVELSHRPTGRTPGGFVHRAAQGRDIVRELWPRLTTPRLRIALTVAMFLALTVGSLWSSARGQPVTTPIGSGATRVLLYGMPGLAWEDLGSGVVPNVAAMVADGAVAAMSVRTVSPRATSAEGYASLGAGARARTDDLAAYAFDARDALEGDTAEQALERRVGRQVSGEVVVVGAAAARRQSAGRHLPSEIGAMGESLRVAGVPAAVVGNADTGYVPGRRPLQRPAAAAVMDTLGGVDLGVVGRSLLTPDPAAPFGFRADPGAMVERTLDALKTARVVVTDTGDLDRAAAFSAVAAPSGAQAARDAALRNADHVLGELRDRVGADVLVLVVPVVPPGGVWHLTPLVASGPDVRSGTLFSPSTRRHGVVTLTDLAPTVLEVVGAPVPAGMIGHALRVDPEPTSTAALARIDREAGYRESIYLRITIGYIVLQALVYLFAVVVFNQLGGPGRAAAPLRWIVLAIAAHPLGTFLFRAVPGTPRLGAVGVVLLIAVDIAIAALALRARRHGLAPLQMILAATVALLVLDVATGARLQMSSILGYSPHTAARFRGLGNTAFAALAASTVLLGAIWVGRSRRPRESLIAVGLLFALVVIADGAPTLGSDVGGILTLVPVFGLMLLALAGRRVSLAMVAGAGALAAVAVAGTALIDAVRSPTTQTHLGRLVSDIQSGGSSPLMTTVARKLSTNFRTFGSPWTWAVVVLAIYMLVVLVWSGGWSRLLPPGSALRAGAVGALAAGLLGYATNDSGIVVTALVFVYLGPYLTLIALEQPRSALEPAGRTAPSDAIGLPAP